MSKRTGIIDIGSNSIRLVIYELHPGGYYKLIDDVSYSARLAQDFDNGNLNEVALKKAEKILNLFKTLCRANGVNDKEIIAVATAAIRNAKNKKAFVDYLCQSTGINIRIISGEEEAIYDYSAVYYSLDVSKGIVVDIGGASTEIVSFCNKEISSLASINEGSVSISHKFSLNEPLNASKEKKIEEYLNSILNGLPWLRNNEDIPIIGLGGTIRALGKMHRKIKNYPLDITHNYHMSGEDFEEIFSKLKKCGAEERIKIKGLPQKRADIILGGLCILKSILNYSMCNKIIISGQGLREGLLYEKLFDENSCGFTGIFSYSVDNAMNLYNINHRHAHNVANLALMLYDELSELHGYGSEERKILQAASLLHDSGIAVNYYDHPEHSAYIILNSRLCGLSHREIVLAACVAASHEKDKMSDSIFKQYKKILKHEDKVLIAILSVFLKIAESLDRSESGIIKQICCKINSETVKLEASAEQNPEFELNYAKEYSDIFKQIFGKTLILNFKQITR